MTFLRLSTAPQGLLLARRASQRRRNRSPSPFCTPHDPICIRLLPPLRSRGKTCSGRMMQVMAGSTYWVGDGGTRAEDAEAAASVTAFLRRQRGSLCIHEQEYWRCGLPSDSLVSAVSVDPVAAATSLASNGSMLGRKLPEEEEGRDEARRPEIWLWERVKQLARPMGA